MRCPLAVFAIAALTLTGLAAPAAAKPRNDRDHDGLGNRYERRHTHTSPRRADTDRDRLRDGAEVRRFKTSPHRADTDRDRLKDGAEVRRFKTNPRKRDTDGDGLSDGAEVRRYKTNPRKRDTDGDGVSDGDEIRNGTDPRSRPAPAPGPSGPGLPVRPLRTCSQTQTTTAAAAAAVSAAAPGAVICLAPGSYGPITLNGAKSAEVVLQSAIPGAATLSGASLRGNYLTISGFRFTGIVSVEPGTNHNTVEYNLITGGGQGLIAAPTTNVDVSDVTIRGNKFVGPFGEDAIRLNRYHDGPDPDPYGVMIQGNEFTNIRENGNHSDCLQSVWGGDGLYFQRNYVHDNRCQGFFIKDQPGTVNNVVVEDNLFLRNAAACDPPSSGCGQPAVFQLFGPLGNLVMRRNTIWTPESNVPTTLRGSGWGRVEMHDNVVWRLWSDTSAPFGNYAASNNVAARREGWPATGVSIVGSPPFQNPAGNDFRIAGGPGVTWAPAEQPYGP